MSGNFWAVTVAPGKVYSQSPVKESFRVAMAALTHNLPKNAGRTSVVVQSGNKRWTICNLIPDKCENQFLDILFPVGETVSFEVQGPCTVDLTGNLMPEFDEHDEYSDDEYDSNEMDVSDEDEDMEEYDSDGDDIEEDEAQEAISEALEAMIGRRPNKKQPKIVEITEQEERKVAIKKDVAPAEKKGDEGKPAEKKLTKAEKKKLKREAAAAAAADEKKEAAPAANGQKAGAAETPLSAKAVAKQQQKDKPVEQKTEQKKPEPKPETPAKANGPKTLPSGLVIEDVDAGNGPKAKPGKKVSVRYIGKLTNGKTFDSNTKGAPFTFKLGAGEVIRGWDMGVNGMSVGGTRKLTIPPQLAYGSKGAPPDIPRNATLEFEVKLLAVGK